MEKAKLNVLRNYPYMHEFIEKSLEETQLDINESIEHSKNMYLETIERYHTQGSMDFLRGDISSERLDSLIRFTVDGLTKEQIRTGSFQPEMLYEQICSYLDTLQALCSK